MRIGADGRPYLLRLPAGARGGPLPLLVELHGRGVDPRRFDRITGFGELADEQGFALALPGAAGGVWNDGRRGPGGADDVSYLVAVIDDVLRRAPVDGRRVYVVGMSNGAAMAARLACERAERVTALAQVAGTAAAAVAERSRPALPVPLIHVQGSADRFAPAAGGVRSGLRARLVLPRAWGPSVGVEEWARLWVDVDRAVDGPHTERLAADTTARTWHGGAEVVFCLVEGGGHTWPGSRVPLPRALLGRTSRAFDATRAIWDFLARQSRDA